MTQVSGLWLFEPLTSEFVVRRDDYHLTSRYLVLNSRNVVLCSSYVLRRPAVPAPLLQNTTPDYVTDAVAKGFIKEPIDDWIDGAVGMAKPESEWQKPGQLDVTADVRQE